MKNFMTFVILISGLALSLTGCCCKKNTVEKTGAQTEETVTRTVTKEVIEQDTK